MAIRNLSLGSCVFCGKQMYASRADARKVARWAHRGEHKTAYLCEGPGGTGSGYWHLGTLPTPVARGAATREAMREYPPMVTTRRMG